MSEHSGPHADLDQLADALADGQEPAHLAGCAECRARLVELGTATTAVSGALAALGPPAPPADLAERLAAAIDRERAPAPTNVLPLQQSRRTRWLPALGAVAAAAVLVVGGVVLTSGDGGSKGTTADQASSPSYTVNDTGTDYTAASLAAALPGLLSGTPTTTSELAQKATDGGATPGSTRASDATTYSAVVPPDQLKALRDTAGLATCLASLTDPSESGLPLAVDYAMYQGKPALVVVLPSSKPDKVDVFVVPVGCAKADGSLLYFTRLPRP
jgi:hypothetical protein